LELTEENLKNALDSIVEDFVKHASKSVAMQWYDKCFFLISASFMNQNWDPLLCNGSCALLKSFVQAGLF